VAHRWIDRGLRAACLATSVAALSGCSVNNYVAYGPGRADYAGARLEYLDAAPAPGTALAEGSSVQFKVRVRYTVQRLDGSRLAVWFTNTHEAPLPVDALAVPLERTVGAVETVTRTIVVPQSQWDLVLHVGLLRGTERTSYGDIRLTYHVVKKAG
jgi:hypothetical protein